MMMIVMVMRMVIVVMMMVMLAGVVMMAVIMMVLQSGQNVGLANSSINRWICLWACSRCDQQVDRFFCPHLSECWAC